MSTQVVERERSPFHEGPRPGVRAALRRPLSVWGLAAALGAWWMSLGPSLLPRAWTVQAFVSGVALAGGYGLGTALGATVRAVGRRVGLRPDRAVRAVALQVVAGAALVGAGALFVWPLEQDAQRALVGLPPAEGPIVPALVAGTALIAGALGAAGRLLAHGVRLLDGAAMQVLRLRSWRPAVAAMLVVLLPLASRDVVASGLVVWADDRFGALEEAATDHGVRRPWAKGVSGGPASLIAWEGLGYEGRRVVADVTPVAELSRASAGRPVTAPVRVYVGERSAPTLDARVALAVRELERTGGFDRAVLAVVVTTGRGGVARDALRALEHLHRGDTAVVALQYGHLPSWVSYLVDREASAHAATALHAAVRERWERLPAQRRPRLVVFGESLGAYGAEAIVARRSPAASLTAVEHAADAALLVGPTAANPLREQLTAVRPDPRVTVATGASDLARVADRARSGRGRPAVVYLEHPSDPVRVWSLRTIWRPPPAPPGGTPSGGRSGDVPARARWVPFVTWLQTLGDLATASAVPSGHGHDYDREFLAAWELVAPPPGWDDTASDRLAAFLGVD